MGVATAIGNQFHPRPFRVLPVLAWPDNDCKFIAVKEDKAPDREDSHTVHEEFQQHRITGLTAFLEHHLQGLSRREWFAPVDARAGHRIITGGNHEDSSGERLLPGHDGQGHPINAMGQAAGPG